MHKSVTLILPDDAYKKNLPTHTHTVYIGFFVCLFCFYEECRRVHFCINSINTVLKKRV